MDWNDALSWIALAGSGVLFVRAWPHRRQARGWLGVAITILVVTGAGWWVFPQVAGLAGGGLFVALVLAPSLLSGLQRKALIAQRYDVARRLGTLVRVLHPFDGTDRMPMLLQALHLATAGNEQEAFALLEKLRDEGGAASRQAASHLLRLRMQWHEALAWMDTFPPDELDGEWALFVLRMRALGETGRLDELASTWKRLSPRLAGETLRDLRTMGRLMLFVFFGRTVSVDKLLARPLRGLPACSRDAWRATALMAAGDVDQARALLAGALAGADHTTRPTLEARLAAPLPAVTPSPAALDVLARADKELDQDLRYGDADLPAHRIPAAITTITAMCLAVYVADLVLAGERVAVVGGVHPELLRLGETWRLLTYMFVHAGFLHLAMNLLGLWVLGRFVERTFGVARTALLFVAGGGVAAAVTMALMAFGVVGVGLLVGASGGIMALLGAHIAILHVGVLRDGAASAGRRLMSMAAIVALQVLFDVTTPQVSFTTHGFGLITGYLLGRILMLRWFRSS